MLLPLLLFPLVLSTTSGQENNSKKEYILASSNPPLPLGQKMESTHKFSMTDAKMKFAFDDQEVAGTFSATETEKLIWEFTSPKTIRVAFQESKSVEKSQMMGEEEFDQSVGAVAGKSVIFEEKDGTWSATLEKGKVGKDEREEFDEEIDELTKIINEEVEENTKTYGLQPRKIGESWQVDPSNLPSLDMIDVDKGTVWMKFVEVKNYNDEPCAILEAKLQVIGRYTEDEMENMNAKMNGTIRVVRSLKYFMDYKITGDIGFEMSGMMEVQPGFNARYSAEGDMKMISRSAFLEKK